MSQIEIGATFKKINIQDKTQLVFELNGLSRKAIPELTKLVSKNVFIAIDDDQPELPLGDTPMEDSEESYLVYEMPLLEEASDNDE